MLYQKAIIKNDKIIVTESKKINQSELTSDCWMIQFEGLKACTECEYLNKKECGGKNIRKKLLNIN